MKTILLSAMLALWASTASATNYYFAANGDDNRTAMQASNPSTPWKTIAKLNAVFSTLRPGDSILFKRGDVFPGCIKPNINGTASAPVVLGAYGSGTRPVISGFVTLTNWINKGNGIWETTNDLLGNRINMLTVNNFPQGIGRYPNYNQPNKGYLTIDASAANTITDSSLTSGINWTGAEVVIRTSQWTLDRGVVTNQAGTTFNFSGLGTITPKVKYGYFFQNDIRTLDQVGEWTYNPTTKKVLMFFGTNNPSSYVVKASKEQDVVFVYDRNYIHITDLIIEGGNENGIDLYSTDFNRVLNCEVRHNGINGIYASIAQSLIIENNHIHNNNSIGIQMPGAINNSVIRNNTIRVSGMIPGMGQNGSNTDVGMRVNANQTVIEYNRIDSSSYAGIRFTGDYVEIRNNLITRFTLLKDDAGGIYTGSTSTSPSYGRKILNNILLDGTGAREGTMYNVSSFGSGIYLDNNTTGVEISGNTVAGCSKYGIYLHNNQDITVRNNTCFNNEAGQIMFSHDDAKFLTLRNIVSSNNILVAREAGQFTGLFNSLLEDLNQFGNIDSNYYVRPMSETQTLQSVTNLYSPAQSIRKYTFEQWKGAHGHDTNSKKSPLLFDPNANPDTLYFFDHNASRQPKTISLNGTYADVNGKLFSGSITLQPYTSIVLMRASAAITYPEVSISKPVTDTSFDAPASVVIAANATDKNGIGYVEFYRGSTLLGRDSIAPYEITWSNAGVGSYRLTAKAFNKLGFSTVSAASAISVVNSNPTVKLTNPLPNAVFGNPSSIYLSADATDSDGIARVEFHQGSTLIGTDSVAPYECTWNVRTTSSYRLTAKAYDVKGYVTTSASVSISVINSNPTVSLTSPIANSSFDSPANILLAANATDTDGIALVEFYQGTTLVGTDSAAPYQINWNDVAPGSYMITAKAIDSRGFNTTTAAVKVTVVNSNPVVSLTSPSHNSSADAPASLRLAATATDADGVARVEFYNGSNLLFSDAAAPYEFLWNNVGAGTYTITARAFDLKGNNAFSAAVNVAVINSTPVISLTAPLANVSFDAPAAVTLAASATDADGIRRVEFFSGTNLLATDSIAPYEYTWNNMQPGTYTVTARATDVKGYTALTPATSFTVVNSNPEISITSPVANSTFDAPASVTLSANAVDADGIARVEFYQGTTLLGSDMTAPYTFTLSNMAPGSYSYTARAIDVKGYSTMSVAVNITVVNSNPEISLTAPVANASFDAPAAIFITANATDEDGIRRVEFYNGSELLGTDSTAPYAFTWNSVGVGNYAISARAVDAKGYTTTTKAVAVAVINSNPEINLTSPVAGSSLDAPASIAMSAQAFDADGIASVAFYNGNTLVATVTTAPYQFVLSGLLPGTYSITAQATDSKGFTTITAAANVTVVNSNPVVTLTSPVAGSSFTAPASVNISAMASDNDGIARVEFFRGTTLMGVDSVAPYALTWNNAAGGSYTITARATDVKGFTTTSAAVNITIAGDKPVVRLTSPVTNATYTSPATVRLTATASDADGIARVEFYRGTTLIATERNAPYDWSWTNVAAGSYVITARAYDTKGNMTVSTSATITVQAPALSTTTALTEQVSNDKPVVKLTSPVTNSFYNAPASFLLSATASDNDGIAKVEFYMGDKLVRVEKHLPYSWNYSNIPAGTYVFTAKAYDKQGNVTVSQPATVTVKAVTTSLSTNNLINRMHELQNISVSATLYPNPAISNLNIQFNQQVISPNAVVNIIALDGRKVWSKAVTLSGNNFTLNIAHLSAGTYILNLSGDNLKVSLPFVKQ